MVYRVNLVLLGVLGAAWVSLTSTGPITSMVEAPDRLAELEESFAERRDRPSVARDLAGAYLEIGQPEMAIAALRSTPPEVRRDPAVLDRLASAYEQTGRLDDALSTAQLARDRCARALGTDDSAASTPIPAHRCSFGTLATLDVHVTALRHMERWGVDDPRTDPRAERAYHQALRRGRILSASLD